MEKKDFPIPSDPPQKSLLQNTPILNYLPNMKNFFSKWNAQVLSLVGSIDCNNTQQTLVHVIK